MRPILLALALAGVAAPALAQSPADQARWDQAQSRYQAETDRFYAERDRFYASRSRSSGYQGGNYQGGSYGRGYDAPPPPPPGGDFSTNYDASRYYRGGGNYQERTLSANDEVYRGSDGQYYCKRSDGTTGLIIGGAAGGVFGNLIDGGRRRTAGTLIGGALGALIGRSADQQQVRCR